MMMLPKFPKSELELYKQKKILIYAPNSNPIVLYKILRSLGFNVIGCCWERKKSVRNILKYCKYRLLGVKIICLSQVKKKADVAVLSLIGNQSIASKDCLQKEKMQKLGLEFLSINARQLECQLSYQYFIKTLSNPIQYKWHVFLWKLKCKQRTNLKWLCFKWRKPSNAVVICMPPKTADHTLNLTFDKVNGQAVKKQIEYINLSHKSRFVDRRSSERAFGTLKIVVGIREPISQNLSRLYEDCSVGYYLENWILGDVENLSYKERKTVFEKYEEFSKGNVQFLWDAFIERNVYNENSLKRSFEPKTVQQFLVEFNEYVLDVLKFPFDKEKGYTIIKDSNTEVFVYQLEKLNSLVSEISDWIGVPLDQLENGNAAEDKWIAESYKQAQKEIEITQEYFDKCFDEPYVKHCYSDADIEKFKEKWRSNIKKQRED